MYTLVVICPIFSNVHTQISELSDIIIIDWNKLPTIKNTAAVYKEVTSLNFH